MTKKAIEDFISKIESFEYFSDLVNKIKDLSEQGSIPLSYRAVYFGIKKDVLQAIAGNNWELDSSYDYCCRAKPALYNAFYEFIGSPEFNWSTERLLYDPIYNDEKAEHMMDMVIAVEVNRELGDEGCFIDILELSREIQ